MSVTRFPVRIARGVPAIGLAACLAPAVAVAGGSASVTGVVPGATPFVSYVHATIGGGSLDSVSFLVLPKFGSKTRPVHASYSAAYLAEHGLLGGSTLTVPIFGLYAGTNNIVALVAKFAGNTFVGALQPIATRGYTDPCAAMNAPVLNQNRTATSDLAFDYFLLKDYCSTNAPAIVDTDGNLRWVGTAGVGAIASTFYGNAIYLSDGKTGLLREDLIGGVVKLADYAGIGVTTTNHHNIDPGRDGLIVDVSTTTATEATDLEVDPATGRVLNRFDLDRIIAQAMIAGGDDPSLFVRPVGFDWFHNNATAYNPADDTLIVSSRENFVIAVDYDVPPDGLRKIHWILGDTTKAWYGFASLRKFALGLGPNTLAPIGQHAVNIDREGDLLLFDDGQGSVLQQPAGITRSYSAARSYRIDSAAMTATEVFTYAPQPSLFSPYCGSAYETAPGNYLLDFPTSHASQVTELQGIGTGGKLVFDLAYPATASSCGSGWNALPISLGPLQF